MIELFLNLPIEVQTLLSFLFVMTIWLMLKGPE